MPQDHLVRKLIIAAEFAPTLRAYSQFDAVGLELGADYPDWERGPLQLELRNKKKHHRLGMSFGRVFFEADGVDDVGDAIRSAVGGIRKFLEAVDVTVLKRLGARHLFAADVSMTMPALVDLFHSRFVRGDEEIAKALGAEASDTSYIVDFGTDNRKYKIRSGPMELKQWMQQVQHEPNIFEDGKDESLATLKRFFELMPQTFLYLDIDAAMSDCPTDRLYEFCAESQQKSNAVLRAMLQLLRGGK